MNSNEIFVRDLNLPQFFACLFVFTAFIFMTYEIVSFIFFAIKLLVRYIIYRFRKQKYKSLDFAAMRAYKYIKILKNDALNAPTEQAFYLRYNRFCGAIDMAVEMGVISCCDRHFGKIVDIRGKFKYIENAKKESEKDG